MFDAEKLLGKIVREVTGSDYGKYDKKKYKKKKKHSNPLINNLKSGTGLLTAIGLGIGAYEILKSKQQPAGFGGQQYQQTPQGYTPPQGGQMAPPPPPPPPQSTSAAPSSPPPATAAPQIGETSTQDLATRMIQTMIAAAHADGTLDEQEEKAILERLKGQGLSQEERMFLLTELHNPKPIAELTAGITDQSIAQAMYMIAVSTIIVDTAEERAWLDDLGSRLGLSRGVMDFLEQQD